MTTHRISIGLHAAQIATARALVVNYVQASGDPAAITLTGATLIIAATDQVNATLDTLSRHCAIRIDNTRWINISENDE